MKKIRITGRKIPTFWNKSLRLMKLTFLFLVVGLMQLSASVYSQSTKLSLDMRNAKVGEVLDAIEKQSEFRFAYSPGYIDLNRQVTVNIHDKTVDESLNVIFAGTDVEYGVFDRHILLYPESLKPGAEPVVSHATGAQQRTVSGRVSDETGQPLPGVTVVIKGTAQGTVTDSN
ncbi:MAG TPA: SusC/RagA family TonB-linked outer membrane protein, partial [Mariniphaga anaerophila]|nr:SusC/RagA family TonB-linked outer membrane protein [Mariniphaga anaerophila]